MSNNSLVIDTLEVKRWRWLLLPREHGAWGMLLIPLATGAWVGRPSGASLSAVLWFTTLALCLFCARTPLEICLGKSPLRAQSSAERTLVLGATGLYGVVTGLALVELLKRVRAGGLLLLGAAAAAGFLAQEILKAQGRERRFASQLMGSLALTSTAAAGYYTATGRLGSTALGLWAANWLFAFNQIYYVQVRVHSARAGRLAEKFRVGRGFLLMQALTILLLAVAWRTGWWPGLALVAFGPVLFRGLVWFVEPSRQLDIRRLGTSELVHALVFGSLFVLSFRIHGA